MMLTRSVVGRSLHGTGADGAIPYSPVLSGLVIVLALFAVPRFHHRVAVNIRASMSHHRQEGFSVPLAHNRLV
jgi:hypothetical protein